MFLLIGCDKQSTDETKLHKAEKLINRVEEVACGTLTGDSKVECLAKKMKNRVEETKDKIIDKSTEIKNKIDSK
jgi:hypothetical protein